MRFLRLADSRDRGVGSIRRNGKHGCTPSPELLEARELLASTPFSSLTRSEAAAWYRDVFDPLAEVVPGWTGDVAAGIPGSLSTSYRNATLGRINAYRYLAGLNDDVGIDPEKSRLAQAAALLMSANNQLSHQPPTSWTHYTSDGAEGAGNSNLALGAAGSFAIDLYMEEPAPAGHRRWLLYPPQTHIGIGDIPTPTGGYRPSNAVHVLRFDGPRPEAPFVAWPAPGYVHHSIVPDAWSFAVDASADFSSANVSVVSGSTSLPVSVVSRGGPNYGDPAIEWTVAGITDEAPLVDRDLEVEITGVRVGGVVRDFRYSLTIFDPDRPGTDDSPVPPPDSGNGTSSSVAFVQPRVSVAESATFVDVVLSRSGDLAESSSIGYATFPGSAGSSDFTPVSGRVVFAPGVATAVIRVPLIPDRSHEPTESFVVRLTDPSGLSVGGTTSATVSIIDDDARQPRIVSVRGIRTRKALTEVAIAFDGTVATPTPDALSTIQLRRAGRDRRFGSRDDKRVTLRGIALDETTGEIRVRLARGFQPRELLQLVVSAGGLQDSTGTLLDFAESLGVSAWTLRS
ncbi:MAG: Calx-beta domain-containing protein [Isosphaeraceae bacterium]|nr:Calx-beta domain-containing protein [Isosphaeraceae bacterium]